LYYKKKQKTLVKTVKGQAAIYYMFWCELANYFGSHQYKASRVHSRLQHQSAVSRMICSSIWRILPMRASPLSLLQAA